MIILTWMALAAHLPPDTFGASLASALIQWTLGGLLSTFVWLARGRP